MNEEKCKILALFREASPEIQEKALALATAIFCGMYDEYVQVGHRKEVKYHGEKS